MTNDHRHYPDPDSVIAFLDDLRNKGYQIGVAQYIAAQKLLVALVTHDEVAETDVNERFKRMLGPLVCTSPEEQADFHRRYDQKFGTFPSPAQAAQATPAASALEQQLGQAEQAMRRLPRLKIAAIGVLIVVLVLLGVEYHSPRAITGIVPSVPTGVTATSTPTPTLTLQPTTATAVGGATSTPTPTRQPTTATVAGGATSTPTPTPTPTDTSPSGAGDTGSAGIPMTWFWIGLSFPLVLLVWLVYRIRQNELILERQATRDQPQTTQLPIRGFEGSILEPMVLFTTARNMRRRVPVLSNELDIPKTLASSLERGGWFTPVYRYRQVMPEYLILVDRTSHRDHQAQFVKHMLDDLKDNAVYTQVYLFDGDPRICFHAEGKEPPCTLEDLTHRYADHRLILFSDGSGLFSPMTGEQEAWTMLFETWHERTLMTPVFVDQWGYQEHVLQNEFVLLPATADGLSHLTDAFYQGDTAALAAGQPGTGAILPDELRMRPLYWTSRNPPGEEQITRMLTKLRRYLNDDASYFWLQACAIYPQLDWDLTLYLGKHLRDEQDNRLLTPQRLIALSRLPWFRQGYMPDWLREHLITTMTPAQETQVRELIAALLKTGVQAGEDGEGDFSLEIAQQHRKTVVAWAKRSLRRLTRQAPDDSPIKDYIFLCFMQGKKLQPLWVRLPEMLRERFPKRHPRLLRAAGAAAVVVLALVTVWAMGLGGNEQADIAVSRQLPPPMQGDINIAIARLGNTYVEQVIYDSLTNLDVLKNSDVFTTEIRMLGIPVSENEAASIAKKQNAHILIYGQENNLGQIPLKIYTSDSHEGEIIRAFLLQKEVLVSADIDQIIQPIIGIVYLSTDQPEQALAIFQRAIFVADNKNIQGTLYFYKGRALAALYAKQKAGEIQDNETDYWQEAMTAYSDTLKLKVGLTIDDTEEQLQQELDKRSTCPYSWALLEQGVLYYERAKEYEPTDNNYQSNLAAAQQKANDSIAVSIQVENDECRLEYIPSEVAYVNAKAYILLGNINDLEGEYELAITNYTNAIEAYGDKAPGSYSARAYLYRGAVYEMRADYDQALTNYDTSIQLVESDTRQLDVSIPRLKVDAYMHKAALLYEIGRTTQAREPIEKAIQVIEVNDTVISPETKKAAYELRDRIDGVFIPQPEPPPSTRDL